MQSLIPIDIDKLKETFETYHFKHVFVDDRNMLAQFCLRVEFLINNGHGALGVFS